MFGERYAARSCAPREVTDVLARPAIPSWMGEVAAFAQILTHEGILKAIAEQVRFARARFDQYDVIDFVAILIGYALSGVLARSRAYHLLDLEVVQQALACSPDQVSTQPKSGMTRALYDCPAIPLTPVRPEVRLVVATHAVTSSPPKIGIERDGTVYEIFISTLPSPAWMCLIRGSFETVLADEDIEQNADRWYSHTPCGQEFCQILTQWVWNLRLELGQKLSYQSCARLIRKILDEAMHPPGRLVQYLCHTDGFACTLTGQVHRDNNRHLPG